MKSVIASIAMIGTALFLKKRSSLEMLPEQHGNLIPHLGMSLLEVSEKISNTKDTCSALPLVAYAGLAVGRSIVHGKEANNEQFTEIIKTARAAFRNDLKTNELTCKAKRPMPRSKSRMDLNGLSSDYAIHKKRYEELFPQLPTIVSIGDMCEAPRELFELGIKLGEVVAHAEGSQDQVSMDEADAAMDVLKKTTHVLRQICREER